MFETGPGSGCGASVELALDLLDVPADAVEPAVDVRAGQPPRLADLPDEQQREQVAVLGHRVDRRGHPRLRSSSSTSPQSACWRTAASTAASAVVLVHPRRALDRRAVDRVDVVTGPPDPLPPTVDEVAQAVGLERLGRRRDAPRVGLRPRRTRLELQIYHVGDTEAPGRRSSRNLPAIGSACVPASLMRTRLDTSPRGPSSMLGASGRSIPERIGLCRNTCSIRRASGLSSSVSGSKKCACTTGPRRQHLARTTGRPTRSRSWRSPELRHVLDEPTWALARLAGRLLPEGRRRAPT